MEEVSDFVESERCGAGVLKKGMLPELELAGGYVRACAPVGIVGTNLAT